MALSKPTRNDSLKIAGTAKLMLFPHKEGFIVISASYTQNTVKPSNVPPGATQAEQNTARKKAQEQQNN